MKLIFKYQQIIFPILDVILNGFNYLFHIFISWYLLRQEYGALNSMLSISSILMVMGISFQLMVAKNVSEKSESVSILSIVKSGKFVSALFILLSIPLIPFTMNLTRGSLFSMLMIIGIVLINIFLSINRGIIQGIQRFLVLNVSFYIETFVKIIFILLVLPFARRAEAVLMSIFVGMLISYIHSLIVLSDFKLSGIENLRKSLKIFGALFSANFLLNYFLSTDMIAINYFFKDEAGSYAVALKYAQIPVFVAMSIMSVFIVKLSSNKENIKKFKNIISNMFGIIVPICIILLIGFYFVVPMTVDYVFGEAYSGAKNYIFLSGVQYSFLVLLVLSMNIQMVLGNRKFIKYMYLGSFLLTILVINLPNSIIDILRIQTISFFGMFLINIVLIHKEIATLEKGMVDMKKNKLTLLFLSWRDIKHPKKGGAEIFTHETIKLLPKEDYNIIHFGTHVEGLAKEEKIDNITYIRKGNPITVILRAIMYYLKNRNSIDFVVDQCNSHHFFAPLWVNKRKRIFFIHQLTREIWCMNMKKPVCKIGEVSETPRLRLSKDDYTITVSNSTKNELVNIGFDPNKTFILPEGIEFKHWKKDEFLDKEKEHTFAYVGRYSNYKGIDDTLMAFINFKKKYYNSRLWIIGKKDEKYIKEVLEPLLIESRLTYGEESWNDVVFWGYVSENKKLELMSRAHALIFPSRREGWGLTITEAAAVGTPSIVYNSPGIIDAVNNGMAGYICESKTPLAITNLMEKVVEDKGRYNLIRDNAYNFSLNFHWENTSKKLDEFFKQVKRNTEIKEYNKTKGVVYE